MQNMGGPSNHGQDPTETETVEDNDTNNGIDDNLSPVHTSI